MTQRSLIVGDEYARPKTSQWHVGESDGVRSAPSVGLTIPYWHGRMQRPFCDEHYADVAYLSDALTVGCLHVKDRSLSYG